MNRFWLLIIPCIASLSCLIYIEAYIVLIREREEKRKPVIMDAETDG